jgi:hypothetical protein
MRPSLRVPALLSLVAALTACDGVSLLTAPATLPAVRTQFASASSETAMPLLLINQSGKEWEYGACSAQLERLESGTWVVVRDPVTEYCILVAYSLPAGRTRAASVRLPAELGTYRVRFAFNHFPTNFVETVWVTSNEFEVVASSPD